MRRMSDREPRRAYSRLLEDIVGILYESDPDGIGRSIDAPADEYRDLATVLLPRLWAVAGEPEAREEIRKIIPAAEPMLIDALWDARCGQSAWRSLTKEQQCVLFSAAEESMLIGVLANWEPELDWPERAESIPRLAAAAVALLRADLIEVYQQPLQVGETSYLAGGEGIDILSDPHNWWRAEDAGGKTGPQANGEFADGEKVIYVLVASNAGIEVMQSRGDDSLYEFLRH
jgi:hypothetical protein